MTDDVIIMLGAKLERAREVIKGLLFAVDWARGDFADDKTSGPYRFFNGAIQTYENWEAEFDKQARTNPGD